MRLNFKQIQATINISRESIVRVLMNLVKGNAMEKVVYNNAYF